MRHDAEQFQAFPFQTAPGKFGNVINFFSQHFVQDDTDDLDALLFKERLVQGNFVDRLTDAALGYNDHFGPKQFGDPRVG